MKYIDSPPRDDLDVDSKFSPCRYKSVGGFGRLFPATRYALKGLGAAWRYEASFRQEVIVSIVFLIASIWVAPSLLFQLLMIASIVLVWCSELFNSAIEALADAMSTDYNKMLGRAKDLGSAAVFVSLMLAVLVWSTGIFIKFMHVSSIFSISELV